MTHYYTLYRAGYTEKYFFMAYERLTGRMVFEGATHDTQAEAETAAQEVTAELDARAARDEEAYINSLKENQS